MSLNVALVVDCFDENSPSWMFDRVLNAPQGYFKIIFNFILDFKNHF